MKSFSLALLLSLGSLSLLMSCSADVQTSNSISLQLPERLLCAAPPQDIKARLWISGMSDACLLDVSADAVVSGSCPGVTARATRNTTLDYYLEQDLSARFSSLENPYTVLLAQAHKDLDLNNIESESYPLNFVEADFISEDSCLDYEHVNTDGDMGRSRITDFNALGSPCDLDADMMNNSGGTNLQELCAGADPFIKDTP